MSYHYNAADRLISIKDGNNDVASYQYDAFGRRISKMVNGEVTYFIYANEGLIGELDNKGNLSVAYGWIPNSQWGTKPLWLAKVNINQTLQSASYHYLITDHLGTPQLAINGQGQQTWKMHSDAFGNIALDSNNQMTLNLRFLGQYYDQETGLSYNYQRDYNPKIGRYLQSDPLGLNGGINSFVYAENNPLKYMDARGELIQFAPVVANQIVVAGAIAIYACTSNVSCRTAVTESIKSIFNYCQSSYNQAQVGLFKFKPKPTNSPHGDIQELLDDLKAGEGHAYWLSSTFTTGPNDPKHDDDCERLKNDIKRTDESLQRRLRDLKNHFSIKNTVSYINHIDRMRNEDNLIKSLINKGEERKCKIPDDIKERRKPPFSRKNLGI